MYSKAFDKFYWGFLFIMLNIPIIGFDILPDIVGYILIYQGLSLLEEEREEFEIGKKFAFPMIFLSILTIYDFRHFIDKGNVGIIGVSPWIIVFNLLIGVLMIILNFKLIYNILWE